MSSANAEPAAPLMDDRSYGNASRAPDPMRLLDDAAPGGDFLDALLGSDKPRGPGQFRGRQDEIDLLPPLGEDGPLLRSAPVDQGGPAMRDHSAAGSDAFRAPVASRSAIPDDWDDLLAPEPAPVTPVPPPSSSATMIPDDDTFGLEPDAAAPAVVVETAVAVNVAAPAPPAPPDAAPAPEAAVRPPAVQFDPFATLAPSSSTPVPFDPFATDPSRPSRPPADSAVVAPPAMVASPAAPAVASDAARAFLLAIGAENMRITDAELPDTMTRLGKTLKSMITGLREILMTRTSIKSEFRIEQTMVNVGGNNPLKFSISPEQAIEAMVKPTVRGYLTADKAAEQALEDIRAHEVAMVTGMEAALKGVLSKLDPALLTQKIEAKGGFGGFLKNRKAQYWETYEAMYAEISDQAENDFHELFAREFAKAYKDQLARLKAQNQK
ncbi:MAG: type VI secretion system-associated FHA domain protein TagH [Pseudorhodobacter sp.]|nr:type VI secretion system-associated FHA domain protein TagH [Pseudorhodobacter sp.]